MHPGSATELSGLGILPKNHGRDARATLSGSFRGRFHDGARGCGSESAVRARDAVAVITLENRVKARILGLRPGLSSLVVVSGLVI